MEADDSTKAGTIGGTLVSIFCNLHKEDIAKTITLAGLGAIVSFLVSITMKTIYRWFKK